MNKYQTNAKLYCIRTHQSDEIYIGSTCTTLTKRLYMHRANFKNYQKTGKGYVTSYKLLEYGDEYIELIEMYPCNNRMELNRREGARIRNHPNCVNKVVAGRTLVEYRVDNIDKSKQYYKDNSEKIKEAHNSPEYQESHRIAALKYAHKNMAAVLAYNKQYVEKKSGRCQRKT